MSKDADFCRFFFKVADLGMKFQYEPLYMNALEILRAMPIDASIQNSLILDQQAALTSLLTKESPTKFRYTLEVIYSLLFPASQHQNCCSESLQQFQSNFIMNGSGLRILELLTKQDYLQSADYLNKV